MKKDVKIIFVIGGIFSGIGKGILSCGIANIIKANGFKVSMQKHDPYLNIDSGLMNPKEHGEVFVTHDGLETDLDLGNYERFLNQEMTKYSSVTSGQIYKEILQRERNGEFKGKTVNIYDVAKFIQKRIEEIIAFEKCDCLIVELGGTVGDNDLTPFLITVAKMQKTNYHNVIVTFLTYVSFLEHLQEFKTKPAQNSISLLRTFGIEPNFVFMRSRKKIPQHIKLKLSKYAYLNIENIFSLPNINIYKVPNFLKKIKFLDKLFSYFKWKIDFKHQNWNNWIQKIETLKKSSRKIKIAIVNKYPNFEQSYLSLFCALKNASFATNINFEYQEIDPESLTKQNITSILKSFDAILIPGGFGKRGTEGKILAINYARINKVPFFGICFGMQLALIEYARTKLNIKDASSEEFFDQTSKKPLIIVYDDKKTNQMIRGTKEITIQKNTLTHQILNKIKIYRRHRHRFIFNWEYFDQFNNQEMIFSGFKNNNNKKFVLEIFELKNHPFFIGVQFHEELTVYPEKPSLLLNNFFDITYLNKIKIKK